MPVTIPELAAEIAADPLALGYAAHVASGNDQAIADLLNARRATISVKRPNCTPDDIIEAIDIRDFLASPPGVNNMGAVQSYLQAVLSRPAVRLQLDTGGKTLIRKNIDRLIADAAVQGNNGSQARLDAVAVRPGSRAEQLFGFDVPVTGTHVALALRPPGGG